MPEVMRGRLGVVRLASLLQLAEAEMVTGRVVLQDRGEVRLCQGRVVGAGARDLDGLRALIELFTDDEGPFVLHSDARVQGTPLGPLIALIMEGCRIADEWERLAPLVLGARDPTELRAESEPVRAVLGALDGRSTLAQAVRRTGVARADCVDPLLMLCEAGHLVEVGPPGGEPSGRAPTPAPAPGRASSPDLPQGDYFGAMDLGRRFLREKRLDDAEAAFRCALETRPDDRIAAQNLNRVLQAKEGTDKGLFAWFRR